jgi:hypothetical protein
VPGEREESKTKRWPAARQAAPRLMCIPLANINKEGKEMKRNVYFILLSLIFILSCNDIDNILAVGKFAGHEFDEESEYYWAGGEKVVLNLDRRTVIGIYKIDSSSQYKSPAILHFNSKQYGSLRNIIAENNLDPDQFAWLSFGYTHEGIAILPTNHIAFSLKPGFTLNSLDSLIHNDAEIDSTWYGTLMLKVKDQEGNVFDIANKIFESGIVYYSTPDFIELLAHKN